MNTMTNDRDTAILSIRTALKRRSGKPWSVKGGRGTSWGWIEICAPPARCTWGHRLKAGATDDRPENYEGYDTGRPGMGMTPTDTAELAALLAIEPHLCGQHVSIPAGTDYREEYIARAEGRTPERIGQPYWD